MGTVLDAVSEQAQQIGVFEYLIPFAISFGIVYGILRQTSVFGEPDDPQTNKINSAVSLAIAFFVAFSGTGASVSAFLGQVLPGFLVVMVAILGIMLAAGLVFGEELTNPGSDNKLRWIIGGVAALAIFGLLWDTVFTDIVGLDGTIPGVQLADFLGVAIMIGILAMVYWTMKAE